MLEALRQGANSWVLKPLLLLLVLAFVVWGVADVFTGTSRQGSLASVGAAEISVEEFQTAYGNVMTNISRRTGRRPTAEEARLRGIDRSVLDELINGATLDNQARSLGLSLPQSAVAAAIEKDPALQGPDGKFQRSTFEAYLRELGFSERGYLAQRRREELRQQLIQPMFQDLPVSKALAGMVHTWREETRTIQHFTVDAKTQVKLGEPDEAKLKETYEARKGQFVTPEYRNVVVLVLSGAEVAKSLEVPEAELRRAYDGDAGLREVAEKRRVQQIPFKDKAAAEAAAKALAGGKSFLDVAKEQEATEKDVDLGLLTRPELRDPAVAEAAFKLEKDKVSAPVAGRFATFLVRVTEIQPARIRPFEEVRQEIRDALASKRVNEAVRKLHDAVDDGRAAGRPLKDIAETVKLKAYELNGIDRTGRKADGTRPYDGPEAAKVLRAAFEGKQGVEIETIDLEDGGYGWIDVLGVTEEKQRPYEDVQADVRKVWEVVETSRLLTELGTRLVERADKGETLTALAKEVGAKLATSKPFKRFGSEAGVSNAVVQRAFGMQLGARASVETAEGQRTVFRLVEIGKPQPATAEQTEQISQQLKAELQQDAVQAYVLALRERYGVRENKALLDRTVGGTGDQR